MENSAFDFDSFLQKYKYPLVFCLLGLILLGLGVLTIKKLFPEESKIEIANVAGEPIGETKLVADIAGAVIKPGVYELIVGSRINDLLILAEGLAAEADRDWVAKNINLAQRLTDGAKIYIPSQSERVKEQESVSSKVLEISGKININTATEKELDTLYGIGPATAQKIIEGRPYQKPEDLLYKKIIKSNVWEKIKDRVTVY